MNEGRGGVDLVVVIGGDALAARVCDELISGNTGRVVSIWYRDRSFGARISRPGIEYVEGYPGDDDVLRQAGIETADSVIALTEDDQLNIAAVLRARDLNPSIRIVLRQYNRTLGRKIQQNLHNSTVISLSSQSAATYAAAAVDSHCYFGVQFPDIDGPIFGFSRHRGDEYGVAGKSVETIERERGVRVVQLGNDLDFACERIVGEFDELVVAGEISPERVSRTLHAADASGPGGTFGKAARRAVRAIVHANPVVRQTVIVALTIFALATTYFAFALHLDPLTAMYFVMATMTTTGYGDITPRAADKVGELASMALMLSGLTFTGIFIAILTAKFAEVQFRESQGLRAVRRRGHYVVCGAGNVGSRVIEFLVRMRVPIVVIEREPSPEILARAKQGDIQLLTGNAASETTLAYCNLSEAQAVIALTNSDTLNLEIALGARARNEDLPIVMRVGGGAFANSIAKHFGLYRTHGTAALAGPVFAGVARFNGVRGRVTLAGRAFAISEYVENGEPDPEGEIIVPLAVWRDECVHPIRSFDQARIGERVLFLYPVWRYRRDGRLDEIDAQPIPLPPLGRQERAAQTSLAPEPEPALAPSASTIVSA